MKSTGDLLWCNSASHKETVVVFTCVYIDIQKVWSSVIKHMAICQYRTVNGERGLYQLTFPDPDQSSSLPFFYNYNPSEIILILLDKYNWYLSRLDYNLNHKKWQEKIDPISVSVSCYTLVILMNKLDIVFLVYVHYIKFYKKNLHYFYLK